MANKATPSSSVPRVEEDEEELVSGSESGCVEARTNCDRLATALSSLDTHCSSDLSVWCYSCDAYLDTRAILPLRRVYETAYLLKFGKAPPVRLVEYCDHLATALSSDLTHIPTLDAHCTRCHQPNGNWLCLCCKDVLCSRFINKHMLEHYQETTTHCVALSYSDLSVWCYSCDAYLDARVILPLRPVYETAYLMKFGKAPPVRLVEYCDHLATALSSDLTHIPTLDTHCTRCHHPNENWLCLGCNDVLCSRFINKHMLEHYQETTTHCVALSCSDLLVWCYSCDAYLDARVILPLRRVYETAYLLKFGKAPPVRLVEYCDHLATALSSDLTHIPSLDANCTRCHHPNENWLCLCCKDVLCSRFINKHMLEHYQETTTHCVALSYSVETSRPKKTIMSTSSNGCTIPNDYLRFRNKTCWCGLRAAVRISESERNPGRLYYGCPKEMKDEGRCNYWKWCNPIGYHPESDEGLNEVNLKKTEERVQAMQVVVQSLKYRVNVLMLFIAVALVVVLFKY